MTQHHSSDPAPELFVDENADVPRFSSLLMLDENRFDLDADRLPSPERLAAFERRARRSRAYTIKAPSIAGLNDEPATRPRRIRRIVVGALIAAAIAVGLAVGSGAATAAAAAPTNSPGYAIGPFTHQGCLTAAARNAAYFHSHGGGRWNYTCWSTRSGWFYTSPYAA